MSEQSQDKIDAADRHADTLMDWRREKELLETPSLQNCIDLLRIYNEWRRGSDTEMPEPRAIGEALDRVLDKVEGKR